MTPQHKKREAPFSREKWLETALDTLAAVPNFKFNLDILIKAMPVTKGSFYNHFKNRHEFLLALADYWRRHYTHYVIDALSQYPGTRQPEQWLLELVYELYEMDLLRFEQLIRSLGREIAEIEETVKRVDLERYQVLEAVFSGLGFTGGELDMRIRIFMTVISQESNLSLDPPDGDWSKQLQARVKFLTRP